MAAEFLIGALVWVEIGEGYLLPGRVKSRAKDSSLIIEANGKEHDISFSQLTEAVKKRDAIPEKGTEDMIKLSQLHEGSMVYNLKLRYKHNLIYTYTGSILIAINPYHMFDIYNVETARAYEGQLLGALPPHIFAIANSAYMHMNANRQNECLVVSGESGAGKTETTKLVLQYLAIINKSTQNPITEKILEATPILESFGNAKTIRNDNSSRFGKYTEVFFDKQGLIEGAKISDYLLEKSRIVFHADEERNYHVFYEMVSGLSQEQLDKLGLLTSDKYFYLNQGRFIQFEGKDDTQDFQRLNEAIDFIGIHGVDKEGMFHLLSSILHLGNICFRAKSKEDPVALYKSTEALVACCSQLQVNQERLQTALVHKRTVTRGEEFHTPLSVEQALDARDALAKALYSHLFNWLVMKINSIVHEPLSKYSASIAVLDIFGFEMFQINSLEQLCINYANEQLQYYFNQYIFYNEQEEYMKEKIDWKTIEFRDNQPCIDLISKYPIGLLHILDDESHFPKSTDESFLEKCHHEHSQNSNYIHPKQKVLVFGIRHYAGNVWYNVEYFLDKNRDVLRNDYVNILQDSKLPFISSIFTQTPTSQPNQTISGTATRKRMPTVAAKFSSSLNSLIETMKKCHPFFVRCIKPNDDKLPLKFIEKLVLEQLRYSGMLETIRIRKSGYPVRLDFDAFLTRFHFLARNKEKLREMTPKGGISHILKSVIATGFQIGRSKVFLRETTELFLEKTKLIQIQSKCVTIQKVVRCYLTRMAFLRIKASVCILQSAVRGFLVRKRFLKLRKYAIYVQSIVRMTNVRRRYFVLVEEKRRSDREKIQKQALKRAEQVALQLSKQRIKPKTQENIEIIPETQNEDESNFIFPPPPPPLSPEQVDYGFNITKLLDAINTLWTHPHIHTDLKKLEQDQVNQIMEAPTKLRDLPKAINNCPFSKYARAFFQEDREWIMVKNKVPISFLKLSPSIDKEAKVLFLLVQEFMSNDRLSLQDEITFGNYIIHKALTSPQLQEELIVQICNQTRFNYNEDELSKAWVLLALCMCSFPLPKEIHPFMLNYVSNYAYDGYKAYCQYRLLRTTDCQIQRSYPPCLLEWRSAKEFNTITLNVEYSDIIRSGKSKIISVDSWTKGHDLGAALIKSRITSKLASTNGWSVLLQDDIQRIEIPTFAYVLDPISLLELPPFFTKQTNSPYLFSWKGVKPRNFPTNVDGQSTPTRLRPDKLSTYLDDIFDPIFTDPDNRSLNQSISFEDFKQLSTPNVITADSKANFPPKPSTQIFRYPKIETCPIAYTEPPWHYMLRKEYFRPGEDVENPIMLDLLFFQILQDVFSQLCLRISPQERQNMLEMFREYNITLFNSDSSIAVKKSIINAARSWQCYFSAIFPVSGVGSSARFTHIGVGHSGITLIKQQAEGDTFQALDTYEFNSVHECTTMNPKLFKLSIGNSRELQFVSELALHIVDLINDQISMLEADYRFVLATREYVTEEKSLLSFTKGSVIKLLVRRDLDQGWLYGEIGDQKGVFPRDLVVPIIGDEPTPAAVERAEYQNNKRMSLLPAITEEEDRTKSVIDLMLTQMPKESDSTEDYIPSRRPPLITRRSSKLMSRSSSATFKWAMTEFAAKHFRFGKERVEYEKRFASSIRIKKLTITGSIREKFIGTRVKPSVDHFSITRLFTYTKTPLESSLLRLDPNDINLNKLAVEGFLNIMIFMGDYMSKGRIDAEIVTFLLKLGLESEELRDELFCQLVKQTTNNSSHKSDSCGRGWRLMYICTSFFPCSVILQSYLLQHFQVISDDTQSLYHGIAMNCLIALRKTCRIGARQNLPGDNEINALLASKYSKLICVFLPGNLTKVVKIFSHTTVHDVKLCICEEMGIVSSEIVQEFLLFIDFGEKTQILPLEANEYMFDVINLIEKEFLDYKVFFKRVLWFHQLKLKSSLLTEIAYYQVLKNYMKGNIIVMDEESNLIPTFRDKVLLLAALQHRALGNPEPPECQDMVKIIPKCIWRSLTPQQWIKAVMEKFEDIFDCSVSQAKSDFVLHASSLPHAGSAFFRIFNVSDHRIPGECILAINKFGVHFLDTTTHRSIFSYALQDVVSTRKIRSHDGRQFLDIKFGNLMLQRIIRCETPQNHEIGPIVRQYVKFHMESALVKSTEIN